jgi:hypothetical protein
MAKVSKIKAVLTGAAVTGIIVATVLPSQAAGLWGNRFAMLKSSAFSNSQGAGGWKMSLIQYRAYKYDQRLSKFLGRPVSPFCRFFC